MRPRELSERLAAGTAPAVVDVRTGFEYRAGHIPGAINAPIWRIILGLAPLPRDKERALVILCELGPRAVMAQGLLWLLGYRNAVLLEGHMAGWRRAGLPQER